MLNLVTYKVSQYLLAYLAVFKKSPVFCAIAFNDCSEQTKTHSDLQHQSVLNLYLGQCMFWLMGTQHKEGIMQTVILYYSLLTVDRQAGRQNMYVNVSGLALENPIL